MADATPAAGGERPRDNHLTSPSLLDKLRTNDAGAGERLNHLYRPFLRYWCHRRGVAPQDVEDVCQNVFQVVIDRFQRPGGFRRDRPGDSFRGWLRGIIFVTIQEHFRKLAGGPRAAGGTDAGLQLHNFADPMPEENEEDPEEQKAALIHRALELIRREFSDRDWQVFKRRVLEKTEFAAVAQEQAMTEAAVRKVVHRIQQRVRAELGDP